jgi:hypothetical protein
MRSARKLVDGLGTEYVKMENVTARKENYEASMNGEQTTALFRPLGNQAAISGRVGSLRVPLLF